MKKITSLLILTAAFAATAQVPNGSTDGIDYSEHGAPSLTSKSPLMGWASWNTFGVNISESIIKGQADALVSSGLSAVGYKYINIDDGFFDGRTPNGTLKINTSKFPNGMKAVADYIHSKELKAGFYSEAGSNTCGSQYDAQTGGIGGGLYNHDQQDIDLFFKTWGFDFLKVDYCGGLVQKLDEKTRYAAIKKAIDNTGLSNVNYNVCRWQFPGSWVTSIASSWRISTDINASWGSVTDIIDKNTFLAAFTSAGHYNDMDMLEVGMGMTAAEDKSHFSMWCMLSAPLVLGNDLTKITQQTKNILMNEEVIAIDQDTTGVQAHLLSDNGAGLQIWSKNIDGQQSKERAVVLFNRTGSTATMTIKFSDLNLVGSASVRDLWSHTDLGSMKSYSAQVPSHGVVMLKIVGTQSRLQELFEAEYSWINNYNLTQNATVVSNQGRAIVDAICSGMAKAEYIGNRADNYIEFRNVYANNAGTYTLLLSYLSAENRSATISINGKDTLLSNLNSGSWSTPKSISFPVKLNKGYNIIRMGNATGWAPNIDKIQLDLNAGSITSVEFNTISEAQIQTFPNPSTGEFQIQTSGFHIEKITITDLAGKTVFIDQAEFSGNKTLNLDQLSKGVYMINFKAPGQWITKKLIIQ
jgi:hypothetical protein